jgi:hypothetical protein
MAPQHAGSTHSAIRAANRRRPADEERIEDPAAPSPATHEQRNADAIASQHARARARGCA